MEENSNLRRFKCKIHVSATAADTLTLTNVYCADDYLMTKDTEWVEVRRLIFKVAKLVCLPADVAKKRRV